MIYWPETENFKHLVWKGLRNGDIHDFCFPPCIRGYPPLVAIFEKKKRGLSGNIFRFWEILHKPKFRISDLEKIRGRLSGRISSDIKKHQLWIRFPANLPPYFFSILVRRGGKLAGNPLISSILNQNGWNFQFPSSISHLYFFFSFTFQDKLICVSKSTFKYLFLKKKSELFYQHLKIIGTNFSPSMLKISETRVHTLHLI